MRRRAWPLMLAGTVLRTMKALSTEKPSMPLSWSQPCASTMGRTIHCAQPHSHIGLARRAHEAALQLVCTRQRGCITGGTGGAEDALTWLALSRKRKRWLGLSLSNDGGSAGSGAGMDTCRTDTRAALTTEVRQPALCQPVVVGGGGSVLACLEASGSGSSGSGAPASSG